MSKNKVNVAIVGLGFGAQFIPIYKRHPMANMYAICRRSKAALDAVGDAFAVERRYERFEDVLADHEVDFVHINSPLGDHGWMTIAALEAGKNVMCTVPMALSTEECRQIVELVRDTGLKYMMAETVLYSREYLYARELYRSGRLGRIQFLQGSHHQDMEGWPDGWPGLPAMYYATHCIAPCLSILDAEAEHVSCFGSGRVREDLIACYGSPFAIETAHISLRNSDVVARVYRCLFDAARQYRESFDVFGTRMSIEWPLIEGEGLILHTAKQPQARMTQRATAPDYAHLLPEAIRHFTTKTFLELPEYRRLGRGEGADPDGTHAHLVADPGSLEGHGGSHPHLVHEFFSALFEDRDPFPDGVWSANITCAGILAHESAMKGGVRLRLPDFTLRSD
ncbi:MAG TPA: Gfo/Idh/MocA family oxidoreductase [Roseiarcus sp.]|jgi:predicted dehydrogenase|nr:Gfo/Idh/MocA family oxidoreductase [Roseiarcus sp.]